jgi:ribose 5-phosphate isomerase B
MNIALSSDHAGFLLKGKIIEYLKEKNFNIIDFGSYSEESVDYTDFAHPMALSVEKKECEFGISICGSGNGINMTANKHQGIRAALCWNVEISQLARQHNNANVLSLPARFISEELALQIVDAFVHTEFEGGRHQKRIDKIPI